MPDECAKFHAFPSMFSMFFLRLTFPKNNKNKNNKKKNNPKENNRALAPEGLGP